MRKKWHHQQRNLKVGDICFLKDPNLARGQFRRCRVSNIFPDKSNVVRNVEVLAANQQDGSASYHPQNLSRLKRHVSNLIVIVPVDEEESSSGVRLLDPGSQLFLRCAYSEDLDIVDQMEKKEEDGWLSTSLEEELGPPQELLAGNEKEDDSFGQKHGSSEL